MKILLWSRICFVVVWIIACMQAVLSELGVFPVAYVRLDAAGQYVIQLVGIVLTLACIYVSLKWYKFSFVKRRMTNDIDERNYHQQGLYRVVVIAVPILYNLFLYYATLNSQLSFCFLISMLASVFCWPKEKP